jgi:hypothetical protein
MCHRQIIRAVMRRIIPKPRQRARRKIKKAVFTARF